jgi:2'-5' RNA ligase
MARLRTFIAIDLGSAIREHCVALQETLARGGAEVKWVETENLHLTLLFLGEVHERDVTEVCRAVTRVCAGVAPFELRVEGVGCFPNARRPRIVWAGVTAGVQEVVALHDALEVPLLEMGCYRREERQYNPHITLGRTRGDHAGDGLAKAVAGQTSWKGGETEVREVRVLSSELLPDGPVYTVLSRARLGG